MKDQDHLKEVLSNISQINEPIDFEVSIMLSIRELETTKQKIANYRKQGVRGLALSIVLVIALVCIYSFSSGFQTFETASIKYTSIIICLIVLFAQLEMGGVPFIHHIKNNKL